MNIHVYSDESGVFDVINHDFYIFGGLIILGKEEKEIWARRYSAAEKVIRQRIKKRTGPQMKEIKEVKASVITSTDKGKLFRSMNKCYKFGVVICQKKLLHRIFDSKKDKQRYLDYAYKIAVKRALCNLVEQKIIDAHNIERLYFSVDEHTTATNGRYELKEALEQELKSGTYNYNYMKFFPPTFPSLQSVELEYCNSSKKTLIRAADIVANKLFHIAIKHKDSSEIIKAVMGISNFHVIILP